MREGRTKTEGLAAKNLIWLILIIAIPFYVAENSRKSRLQTADYKQPAQQQSAVENRPMALDVFTIKINDRTYQKNASISPFFPLMATFTHNNPAVTKIRMQHPTRPDLHIIYPIDQPVRIINHETYMRRGQLSSSEFLAMDNAGKVYDRIVIEFKP